MSSRRWKRSRPSTSTGNSISTSSPVADISGSPETLRCGRGQHRQHQFRRGDFGPPEHFGLQRHEGSRECDHKVPGQGIGAAQDPCQRDQSRPGGVGRDHSAGIADSDFRREMEAQTPLGRIGQPTDIARPWCSSHRRNPRGSPVKRSTFPAECDRSRTDSEATPILKASA